MGSSFAKAFFIEDDFSLKSSSIENKWLSLHGYFIKLYNLFFLLIF